MVTVYSDIKYASKEKVETSLWTTHVLINSAYRKVKDKYEKQDKVVTKRRIVKLYDAFIKTVQLFYKGHLQRLCARYADLPELDRLVAGGAVDRSEGLKNTPRVDAMATGVKDQVLNSAYLTLIYLGDLWRYRTQLRHREGRKYDAALAYYRLATDLDPRSGYAYHQMGVIFLEQEKHFEIVYHFYRSLAADEPHPNAAKNLENEFGRVLKVRASASPKGQGPHHVLQDWIVRLHAHFYLGKTFPQHAELEDEVLHRFGLAVKAHDFVDGLLKIALTNICAYQVAKDKVTGNFIRQSLKGMRILGY
jgi:tetratricopeptide (TPR) repeat protein